MGSDALWSLPGFAFMSALQKIASLGYYYVLLDACARLGDEVWYWRGPWIARFSADGVV